SYSVRFGKYLMEFAEKDNRICALTAAMGEGTGISCFKTRFRDRYFDVGIAEEHAVTFASGLAKGGMLPVFAVYSSFLQRAYDELIHDAALQRNPIIIAVDRAGLVGMDGETHQGIFDVSFLTSIPGITVYSPCSYSDIKISLKRALENKSGITAIRFPRGKEPKLFDEYSATENDFDIYGNSGSGNVIISYGRIFSNAYYAAKELGTENFKIIKLNKIFPIDFEALNKNISDESTVFFFEEAVCNGSVSELISSKLRNKCKTVSLPDEFITHSDTDTLLDKYNLSKDKIKDLLKKECRI
ncbi:MAG: transketolase C-terminal domain-containing protein, partial [Acutalibacteraceae bacterium]